MVKIRILFLTLFLLIPAFSFAQTKAGTDKSWQSFWMQFSRTVKNKNFKALNALTLKPFSFGSGIEDTLAEVFAGDKERKNQIWDSLEASVKSGTKPRAKVDGKTSRVTGNNYAVFVLTGNGWRWWGVGGD